MPEAFGEYTAFSHKIIYGEGDKIHNGKKCSIAGTSGRYQCKIPPAWLNFRQKCFMAIRNTRWRRFPDVCRRGNNEIKIKNFIV